MRPRIGISAYWRGASWGPWTEMPACMVPQGYVEGVRAGGGLPLLIPPDPVYAEDGAAEILGERATEIHSHHHQGLGRVGEGLVVTAVAPDGLVEGVEDPSRTFCLGVLWHPEEDPHGAGLPLFQALVEQARSYRERATVLR